MLQGRAGGHHADSSMRLEWRRDNNRKMTREITMRRWISLLLLFLSVFVSHSRRRP